MRCYNCENSHKDFNNDYECAYMPQCLMADVERRLQYDNFKLKIGSKIKFLNNRCWWTIISRNERFLICARKTKENYCYTICDLQECIRGKDNYLDAHYQYNKKEEADKALQELNKGSLEISYRNWTTLDIIQEKDK